MKLIGPSGPINVQIPPNSGLGYDCLWVGNDHHSDVFVEHDGNAIWVCFQGHAAKFSLPDSLAEVSDHESRAPMTGKVVSIPVKQGDAIKKGDTVAILEAMKMEYRLEAEADGIVEELGAKEGELVDLGQLLVRLK